MNLKLMKVCFSVICVAIFFLSSGVGNQFTLEQRDGYKAKSETDSNSIIFCTNSLYRGKSSASVNGNCAVIYVYPCVVGVCQSHTKTYYIDYLVETIMNAGLGWEIMGGEPQAGHCTYCYTDRTNAGWSTILHMEYPACCANGPSSTNRPSCWPFNSHNLNANALPPDATSIGSGDTLTTTLGFNIGASYSGVSAGVSMTDSKTVTYGAMCICPIHLTQSCLEFESSDNMGEKTSNYITAFTVFMGTAIQFNTIGQWEHIFICENTHFVSTTETCHVTWGGRIPVRYLTYSMTTVQIGGGFSFLT